MENTNFFANLVSVYVAMNFNFLDDLALGIRVSIAQKSCESPKVPE
jgi:hypothetical protein